MILSANKYTISGENPYFGWCLAFVYLQVLAEGEAITGACLCPTTGLGCNTKSYSSHTITTRALDHDSLVTSPDLSP